MKRIIIEFLILLFLFNLVASYPFSEQNIEVFEPRPVQVQYPQLENFQNAMPKTVEHSQSHIQSQSGYQGLDVNRNIYEPKRIHQQEPINPHNGYNQEISEKLWAYNNHQLNNLAANQIPIQNVQFANILRPQSLQTVPRPINTVNEGYFTSIPVENTIQYNTFVPVSPTYPVRPEWFSNEPALPVKGVQPVTRVESIKTSNVIVNKANTAQTVMNQQPAGIQSFNIDHAVAANPLIKDALQTKQKKRYLVIYPNGEVGRIDDLDAFTKNNQNYVLLKKDKVQSNSQLKELLESAHKNIAAPELKPLAVTSVPMFKPLSSETKQSHQPLTMSTINIQSTNSELSQQDKTVVKKTNSENLTQQTAEIKLLATKQGDKINYNLSSETDSTLQKGNQQEDTNNKPNSQLQLSKPPTTDPAQRPHNQETVDTEGIKNSEPSSLESDSTTRTPKSTDFKENQNAQITEENQKIDNYNSNKPEMSATKPEMLVNTPSIAPNQGQHINNPATSQHNQKAQRDQKSDNKDLKNSDKPLPKLGVTTAENTSNIDKVNNAEDVQENRKNSNDDKQSKQSHENPKKTLSKTDITVNTLSKAPTQEESSNLESSQHNQKAQRDQEPDNKDLKNANKSLPKLDITTSAQKIYTKSEINDDDTDPNTHDNHGKKKGSKQSDASPKISPSKHDTTENKPLKSPTEEKSTNLEISQHNQKAQQDQETVQNVTTTQKTTIKDEVNTVENAQKNQKDKRDDKESKESDSKAQSPHNLNQNNQLPKDTSQSKQKSTTYNNNNKEETADQFSDTNNSTPNKPDNSQSQQKSSTNSNKQDYPIEKTSASSINSKQPQKLAPLYNPSKSFEDYHNEHLESDNEESKELAEITLGNDKDNNQAENTTKQNQNNQESKHHNNNEKSPSDFSHVESSNVKNDNYNKKQETNDKPNNADVAKLDEFTTSKSQETSSTSYESNQQDSHVQKTFDSLNSLKHPLKLSTSNNLSKSSDVLQNGQNESDNESNESDEMTPVTTNSSTSNDNAENLNNHEGKNQSPKDTSQPEKKTYDSNSKQQQNSNENQSSSDSSYADSTFNDKKKQEPDNKSDNADTSRPDESNTSESQETSSSSNNSNQQDSQVKNPSDKSVNNPSPSTEDKNEQIDSDVEESSTNSKISNQWNNDDDHQNRQNESDNESNESDEKAPETNSPTSNDNRRAGNRNYNENKNQGPKDTYLPEKKTFDSNSKYQQNNNENQSSSDSLYAETSSNNDKKKQDTENKSDNSDVSSSDESNTSQSQETPSTSNNSNQQDSHVNNTSDKFVNKPPPSAKDRSEQIDSDVEELSSNIEASNQWDNDNNEQINDSDSTKKNYQETRHQNIPSENKNTSGDYKNRNKSEYDQRINNSDSNENVSSYSAESGSSATKFDENGLTSSQETYDYESNDRDSGEDTSNQKPIGFFKTTDSSFWRNVVGSDPMSVVYFFFVPPHESVKNIDSYSTHSFKNTEKKLRSLFKF